MALVALFIGAILIVAAFRNTYGALFTALGQDVPSFVAWAAAILALGALGYIPGMQSVSRGLMALVLVVIVVHNYQQILTGLQSVSKAPSANSNVSSATSSTTGVTPIASTATSLPLIAGIPNEISAVTSPSAFSSSMGETN